jgi:hypothetical protein
MHEWSQWQSWLAGQLNKSMQKCKILSMSTWNQQVLHNHV